MKKKRLIIVTASLIFLLLGVGFIAYTSSKARAKENFNLGNKCLEEGKYREAVTDFEKVIKIQHKNTDARIGLAKAYIGLEKGPEAEKVLKEVIEMDAKRPEPYLILAEIYAGQGKLEEAVLILDKSLGIANDEAAKKRSDMLKLQLQPPKASLPAGRYEKRQTVILDTEGRSGTIYYTIDGTKPGRNSIKYEKPLELTFGKTIVKALIIYENGSQSRELNNEYNIELVKSPVSFEDKELEKLIRIRINKPEGDIYNTDLQNIRSIRISGTQIGMSDDKIFLQSFSRDSYTVNNVLHSEPGDIKTLNDLRYFCSLQSIEITHQRNLDISVFGRSEDIDWLKNIETVNFAADNISDISALSKLSGVTSLNLQFNNISDITAISELLNLKQLVFAYNRALQGTKPLENLSKLEAVDLSGVESVDLNILKGIKALRRLTILDVNNIDYNLLKDLSVLESLCITCNESNINVLGELTFIKQLRLFDDWKTRTEASIIHIGPIGKMTNLEELALITPSCSNIDALKSLIKLKKLEIDVAQSCNLEVLKDLPELKQAYSGNADMENRLRSLLPGVAGR